MKYFEITNNIDAAVLFNDVSGHIKNNTKYRAQSSDTFNIVTNVPEQIYSHSGLQKYSAPSTINNYNDEHFIAFLQKYFDYAHHNNPHSKHTDGKMFHYNHCYENSLGAYFSLLSLTANNDLPTSNPAKICFGYKARQIAPGALIGNAVITSKDLVVHDWHIWNKINNFIIDLSVTKNGGISDLAANTQQRTWGKAEDHVFNNPPQNATYYGIDFEDHTEFASFTDDLFSR